MLLHFSFSFSCFLVSSVCSGSMEQCITLAASEPQLKEISLGKNTKTNKMNIQEFAHQKTTLFCHKATHIIVFALKIQFVGVPSNTGLIFSRTG
jgi:L-lactate utilization protein LutC